MFGFGFSHMFRRKSTAPNPYPGNVIINPSFDDGATNWNIRTPTNGSAVIQNGRLEFTTTAGSSSVVIDSAQSIPNGNYTVYVEVETNQSSVVAEYESIFTYPTGATQNSDTFGSAGTFISTGTVGFNSGANLSIDFRILNLTGLCYINSIHLVPQ